MSGRQLGLFVVVGCLYAGCVPEPPPPGFSYVANRPTPPPADDTAPAKAPEPPPKDRRAGPDLFDIVMGIDSPEDVERKLKVSAASSPCPEPPGAKLTVAEKKTQNRRKTLCWQNLGVKDSPSLKAFFYDYGVGPVVFDLWLTFPIASWSWLPGSVEADLGPADKTDSDWQTSFWSWGHTDVRVGRSGCSDDRTACKSCDLAITHWPTLKLSVAGATNRSVSVADRSIAPTPWDLRFGYDDGPTSETKLKAAGFHVNIMGCSDQYPDSHQIGVRTCYLDGGPLEGLQDNTEVQLVNDGTGTGIASLEYRFALSAYDGVVRQLTTSYGVPLEDDASIRSWWVGGVGIRVMRLSNDFTVSYTHGRLEQLALKAMYADKAAKQQAKQQAEKKGL